MACHRKCGTRMMLTSANEQEKNMTELLTIEAFNKRDDPITGREQNAIFVMGKR